MSSFEIRNGTLKDVAEMQDLFVKTVKNICCDDYTPEQIKVWISGIENTQRWISIVDSQALLVAEEASKIIGFISLESGNYIDMLYIHTDYQRKGIAFRLFSEMENIAKQNNIKELYSNVSITAKPFFEKLGFVVIREQQVILKSIPLTNYKMIKTLT